MRKDAGEWQAPDSATSHQRGRRMPPAPLPFASTAESGIPGLGYR